MVLEQIIGQNLKFYHLQDYNPTVLQNVTSHVLKINKINPNSDRNQPIQRSLISGDWSFYAKHLVSTKTKFDLILASECTYNPDNFEKLNNLLKIASHSKTIIYLAMKNFYFGCGGSCDGWVDFVKEKNSFEIEIVEKIEASLPRFILKMTVKSENS